MYTPRPSTPLFPSTTLFRSHQRRLRRRHADLQDLDARVRPLRRRHRLPGQRHLQQRERLQPAGAGRRNTRRRRDRQRRDARDRKSTRLNSSHGYISYAVFCLNVHATTEYSTLPLHDALPISPTPTAAASRRSARPRRARASAASPTPTARPAPPAATRTPATCRRRSSQHPPTARSSTTRRPRSEEHTSELQSRLHLVCRLLLECTRHDRVLHSSPPRRSSDLTNADCGGVTPICKTSTRACVRCVADTDCPASATCSNANACNLPAPVVATPADGAIVNDATPEIGRAHV